MPDDPVRWRLTAIYKTVCAGWDKEAGNDGIADAGVMITADGCQHGAHTRCTGRGYAFSK
jgi:hypothetical protein